MFDSKLSLCAGRMVADSTTTTTSAMEGRNVAKTLICRACLVLLGPQDASHNLDSEQDLASKYYGCTGGDPGKDLPPQLVLQSICECCYQMVQKFHDFQRMCEESLRNFEKLLHDIDMGCLKLEDHMPDLDTPSESNESTNPEAQVDAPRLPESTQEIVSFIWPQVCASAVILSRITFAAPLEVLPSSKDTTSTHSPIAAINKNISGVCLCCTIFVCGRMFGGDSTRKGGGSVRGRGRVGPTGSGQGEATHSGH
ncbi:uncharacterized protein LOC6533897 isoform X2 [Drosophila yakuba]|uniref:uncharacterized protein LOC6533897 isoform X2 n=1 Tax=Drosophila yakuba TaxID=7245 RepID=UPI0019307D4B|nr:uncharacterized protein LOC6533897 isoform X2 [Drosophila yakuba]